MSLVFVGAQGTERVAPSMCTCVGLQVGVADMHVEKRAGVGMRYRVKRERERAEDGGDY